MLGSWSVPSFYAYWNHYEGYDGHCFNCRVLGFLEAGLGMSFNFLSATICSIHLGIVNELQFSDPGMRMQNCTWFDEICLRDALKHQLRGELLQFVIMNWGASAYSFILLGYHRHRISMILLIQHDPPAAQFPNFQQNSWIFCMSEFQNGYPWTLSHSNLCLRLCMILE